MISWKCGVTKEGLMTVFIMGDQKLTLVAPIEDIERLSRNLAQACEEARQVIQARKDKNGSRSPASS